MERIWTMHEAAAGGAVVKSGGRHEFVFLMRREDSGAAPTDAQRKIGRDGGRGKSEIKSPVSLHALIVFPSLLQILNTKTNILFSNGNTIMNEKSTLLLK